MRISMILILMFGFTACEQEGVTNTFKVGAPTRGSQSETLDGGFGDVIPNIVTQDAQPATVTLDVQPTNITTDVQPRIVTDTLPSTAADATKLPPATSAANPCIYNRQETCKQAACTSDQQAGIGFEYGCLANSTTTRFTCGWDQPTNSCFQTVWCGESLPSVGLNDTNETVWVIDTTRAPILGGDPYMIEAPVQVHLMPKGSVCSGGKATFAPGTLQVWGQKVPGSVMYSPGIAFTQAGFLCVPNTKTIAVNC